MDPLSVCASIVAVLQLTGTVVQYLNQVKDASNDRGKLVIEISSASGILYMVKDLVERTQADNIYMPVISTLGVENGPLDQYRLTLEELAQMLVPVEGSVRKATKALTWPFHRTGIGDILARIERQKTWFGLALQNDNIGLSCAIQNDLTFLKNKFENISHGVAEAQLWQKSKENAEVLAQISPINFWVKQNDVFEERQNGTGEWILRSEEFQDWVSGRNTTLYCSGIPGSGKTVIASIVVDHLKQTFAKENCGVAGIYCSYDDKEQTSGNLVSSLLQQLLSQRPNIPTYLLSIFKTHKDKNTRPSIEELSKYLNGMIKEFSKIFIVIDAIDECPDVSGVRELLLHQVRTKEPWVHIMITSRPITSIRHAIQGAIYLEISASDDDIRMYLEDRIQNSHRLQSFIATDPALKDVIISTIIWTAKGMFLLAALHIDSLVKKHNKRDIRLALQNLPKELNTTYDRIMQRIWNQNEEDVELAKNVFTWILHSFRPLKVVELQHALAIHPETKELDEEALIDEELLLSVCGGIIIVDHESRIIRLVHYTAQEYFQRTKIKTFSATQNTIAKVCLDYLSSDALALGSCKTHEELKNRLKTFPLLNYTAHYWGLHLKEISTPWDNALEEKASAFLTNELQLYSAGQLMYVWDDGFVRRFPKKYNGLHIISVFGLENIAKLLITRSSLDLNMEDDYGRTPLSVAILYDCKNLVTYFLGLPKININAGLDSLSGPALHTAVRYGHYEVVERLLQAGANIDGRDRRGLTALHIAAEAGKVPIIKLLLSAGCNARAISESGTTALYRAARSGSLNAVQILLREDDRVNLSTWDFWTPLHEAVESGHLDVAKYLIAAGAKPDLPNMAGFTPLYYAQLLQRDDLVELLTKSCTNRNTVTSLAASLASLSPCNSSRSPVNSAHLSWPQKERTRSVAAATDFCLTEDKPSKSTKQSNIPDIYNNFQEYGLCTRALYLGKISEFEGKSIQSNLRTELTVEALGFNLLQLYPQILPNLLHRIARMQSERYKKLIYLKARHIWRLNKHKNCEAGSLCTNLSENTEILISKINGHGQITTLIKNYVGLMALSEEAATLQNMPSWQVEGCHLYLECPLCFEVVCTGDSSEWIDHIYGNICDLVCSFADWDQIHSFVSMADWAFHEYTKHRGSPKWTCNYSQCVYSTFRKANFVQHLVKQHRLVEPNYRERVSRPHASDDGELAFVGSDDESQGLDEICRITEECYNDNCYTAPEPCKFCYELCIGRSDYAAHYTSHIKEIGLSFLKILTEAERDVKHVMNAFTETESEKQRLT